MTTLTEWLAGPRSSDWSENAASESATMMLPPVHRYWVSTVRGIPVEPLVDAMLGPPLVPPNWTYTPSPQEVADEARNDQIRAAYAEQDQVWQARSEVRSR